MKPYSSLIGGNILSAATQVLTVIERLPEILKESGIALPSEYDGSRKGGYLALYQRNDLIEIGKLILLAQIGTIDQKKDAEYSTKSQKYKKFVNAKCQALIQTPNALTSGETVFKVKGAIAVNNSLVIGFSGRSQLEDELLVVATIMKCRALLDKDNVFGGDGDLINVSDIKTNPFLSKEIINIIVRYSGGII